MSVRRSDGLVVSVNRPSLVLLPTGDRVVELAFGRGPEHRRTRDQPLTPRTRDLDRTLLDKQILPTLGDTTSEDSRVPLRVSIARR